MFPGKEENHSYCQNSVYTVYAYYLFTVLPSANVANDPITLCTQL